MNHLRQTLLIASLAALTLATANPASIQLARKPKVGEVHEYKMDMTLSTQGLEIEVSIKNREKVLKILEKGGYVVEETQYDQEVSVMGQAQPSPPDATGEITYSKAGEIVKVEAEQSDPDAMGMGNLMAMIWPTESVDVGSKWSARTKSGITIDHKFEILAREEVLGHDTFKIALESKQDSSDAASGKGVVWIAIKNGVAIKANGQLENVTAGGMLMDSISYTLTLVE